MSEIADAKMIQELKEAALAATPGPWIQRTTSVSSFVTTQYRLDKSVLDIATVGHTCTFNADPTKFILSQRANARFIATANPAAILALIAKVERLEKEADALADEINTWEHKERLASEVRDIQTIRREAREAIAEREAQEASAKNKGDPGK